MQKPACICLLHKLANCLLVKNIFHNPSSLLVMCCLQFDRWVKQASKQAQLISKHQCKKAKCTARQAGWCTSLLASACWYCAWLLACFGSAASCWSLHPIYCLMQGIPAASCSWKLQSSCKQHNTAAFGLQAGRSCIIAASSSLLQLTAAVMLLTAADMQQ